MAKTKAKKLCKTEKLLIDFVDAATDLYEACKKQQKLISDMMPWVANIALPDYALLNEWPIAATKALAKMEAACLKAGKEIGKWHHHQKH